MATTVESTTTTTQITNKELKHLGFVKVLVIQALICLSSLYEYLKKKSGPLKSGVCKVEATVTTTVGPVIEKFESFPNDLLVFLDEKVDVAINEFDKHAPSAAKRLASQGHSAFQKASELAQALLSEAQTKGISSAACTATKKSESYLSQQLVKAWWTLHKVPYLGIMAEATVSRVAKLLEKYNEVVEKHQSYTFSRFFPLVPVNEIADAFKGEEEKKD